MPQQSDIKSALVIVDDTSTEPITTAEAKAHARVDTSDDDTLIDTYITAARQQAERVTGLQLTTASYDFKLDGWPDVIRPPRPPLQAVVSITYTDPDGASQTWSSSNYQVDTSTQPARIMPAYGETYPSIRSASDSFHPIVVRFLAGFGDDATDIPEHIRLAVKFLVSHWYQEREPVVTGTVVSDLPLTFTSLLEPYRVEWFG